MALPELRACEEPIMTVKTCAACDCELDSGAIRVKIGGKTVEVCCEECAQSLREAHAAAAGPASMGGQR